MMTRSIGKDKQRKQVMRLASSCETQTNERGLTTPGHHQIHAPGFEISVLIAIPAF